VKRACITILIALGVRVAAAPVVDEPTVRRIKDEIARALRELGKSTSAKPYYLAYTVRSNDNSAAEASFGALVSTSGGSSRSVEVDLRLGDYGYDSSNTADPADGARPFPMPVRISTSLPADADARAERAALWSITERAYRRAVRTLEHKQNLAPASGVPAFSKETPRSVVDDRAPGSLERARVEGLAKRLSAIFRKHRGVYEGTVKITASAGKEYFVSSEGVVSLQPRSMVAIDVRCESLADDGAPVRNAHQWRAPSLDQLPSEAELAAEIERLANELETVRKAPVASRYLGPVIFEGVAAAQLVQFLLADQLGGTPPPVGQLKPKYELYALRRETPLAGDIGKAIFPAGTSIVDDPTMNRLGQAHLAGNYSFDAEGVPARTYLRAGSCSSKMACCVTC
jgi:hypothetical protein